MARPVNQARWDYWRQVIARQRGSGLSAAEFCRREGVSREGFQVWKRKLRQEASAGQESAGLASAECSGKRRPLIQRSRKARPVSARPAMSPPGAGFLQLPVTAVRPSPWIELALPDGTVVRLPQQNLAALVAVLRTLRGERLELSEVVGSHA
jgi:hypothetical protein